jgi:hypothetical protein
MSAASRFAVRVARALVNRVPPVRQLARGLHEAFVAERAFEVDWPELTPIIARMADVTGPIRLNLLLPGASARHVFGGAATALALFDALGKGAQLRILVTDEHVLEDIDLKRFDGWKVATLDDAHLGPAPLLVPMADRHSRSLPVHRNDRFIATAWWTAHHARTLVRWQREAFALANTARFVYLIQDYEPGFYPWSARWALADQTYTWGEEAIGVFNTAGLREYITVRHPPFSKAFDFEPVLHPDLAAYLPRGEQLRRRPQLLIYGRPGVPRNAFSLIVQGLRAWAASDPRAAGWECLSLGESHPDIVLGTPPGSDAALRLVSLGKVSLAKYARLMSESAVGIGLMISPHPSYPPLEMAAFGMRVLTNRFEGKSLSQVYANIRELDIPSPEAIAGMLARWSLEYRQCVPAEWAAPASVSPLLRVGNPFSFADELRKEWLDA